MKFIHYIEKITNVDVIGVVSFLIFFIFFIAVAFWALRADKKLMNVLSQIPFDKNETNN